MELRTLRYFLVLVEKGTISKAAQALFITQPTLSRQLASLEDSVGKQLYIRGNKRISLTEEGMALYDYAKSIVELADKAEAELMDSKHPMHGNVYIGAGETDAMRLVARAVKGLHHEHPEIRFHFYSGATLDLVERLEKGLLDFVLECEAVHRVGYELLDLPIRNTLAAIVHKDSPLAQHEVIRPKDLEGEIVSFSRQLIKSEVLKSWAGDSLEKIQIVTTHNLILNPSYLIREGFGCTVTYEGLLDTSESSEMCVVPIDPPLTSSNGLIWKKNRHLSKVAQAFLDQIKLEATRFEQE